MIALGIYIAVLLLVWSRDNIEHTQGAAIVLGVLLIPVLFPRVFAWLSSWGFMESLASDSGKGVSVSMAGLFFWILYIIACLFFVFEWSIY